MNKPTIVYEAGESMRFDTYAIEVGIRGIKNILAELGMLPKSMQRSTTLHLNSTKWIRASRAGMFIPEIDNGSKVKRAQVLGILEN